MSITSLFGISYIISNEYVRALVVFILLLFILRALLMILQRFFLKVTAKTKTNIDDLIIEKTSRPLTILAFLLSLVISINEITFTPLVAPVVDKLIYSILIIVVGYLIFIILDILVIRVWKKLTEKTETDIDDGLINLAHSVLRITFVVIIFLYVLNIWGVEIGPFLAGLGIAGIAVALALQPILSNVFSGVALILDQTFKVDDFIKLESGEMGTVYKIGLRATRIKTFDNEIIIVPNSSLANSRIQNFYQPDKRIRVTVEFGVEYGVDPEYIKRIVMEEIEKLDMIDKNEEISVLFMSMGDSALDFKARFWVDDISKKWPAHQEAITRIYRRLYKEEIGIPFPQRTVWLRDEGKAPSINPSDSKFSKHNKKFYSNFGHEYKPEEKTKSKEENPKSEKKKLFSFKNLRSKLKKK